MNYLKFARNVFNFPIANESKAIGLLKKYRTEIFANKNAGGFNKKLGEDSIFGVFITI